jgi:hypothetical protein
LQSYFFVPESGFAQFNSEAHTKDHLLAGCVLHLNAQDGATSADFLWRLGGLYAINDAARKAAPSLSVATQADIAAFG